MHAPPSFRNGIKPDTQLGSDGIVSSLDAGGMGTVLQFRLLVAASALTISVGPASSGVAVIPAAQSPQQIFDLAVADFAANRLSESAAGFDQLAGLLPSYAPQLWQRGIALYYVERYQDCRQQFESHRIVNPNDVENAAWHFLCVARAETWETARAALLPVGPDRRAPMAEIYGMLRGDITPEEVLAAAGNQLSALFYAHLYIGLYLEVSGRDEEAFEHIAAAADRQYASTGGYMHMVARVSCSIQADRSALAEDRQPRSC